MISKILSGVGGVLLVLILVVIPGWVAKELEPLETASSDIIPRSEIMENSTTENLSLPYFQVNENNKMEVFDSNIGESSELIYSIVGDYQDLSGNVTYDLLGYVDVMYQPINMADHSRLDFYFWGSGYELGWDNIYTFSFFLDLDLNYRISSITYGYRYEGGYFKDEVGVMIPEGWDQTRTGPENFTYELSLDDMVFFAMSQESSSTYGDCFFYIGVEIMEPGFSDIWFNFQWEPGYYQETSTTYNNQTITVYEPFIQTISNPFHWYKWSLGVGGILLCSIALISTPMINFRKRRRSK